MRQNTLAISEACANPKQNPVDFPWTLNDFVMAVALFVGTLLSLWILID